MDNIESLLKQILDNQSVMQNDISGMKTNISTMQNDIVGMKFDISTMQNDIIGMKSDINTMQNDIIVIRNDLNSVFEQTADLIEFKTQTNQNFTDIKDTLQFLLHKGIETEKEIFEPSPTFALELRSGGFLFKRRLIAKLSLFFSDCPRIHYPSPIELV